jgi:hypothetical protein
MNEQTRIDPEALVAEVTRYLGVVDAFRAAGCEPTWRPELEPTGASVALQHAACDQTATANS